MNAPALLSLALLVSTPAFGAQPQVASSAARKPAMQEKVDPNRAVFERLNPGSYAIIQNSVEEWNDKLVEVVDKFEDGSVRVKLVETGDKAFIRRSNLATSLSPSTKCKVSHKTEICVGDEVFYPNQAVTIGIPEGRLEHIFDNGKVVVRDGILRVYDAREVGKRVNCSPQKETICLNDYVLGNGYRGSTPFTFEGPVERAYSNGIVVVRSSAFWRFPIDVSAVVERIATTENEVSGAVISSREVREKVPAKITPELEPVETRSSDYFQDAR